MHIHTSRHINMQWGKKHSPPPRAPSVTSSIQISFVFLHRHDSASLSCVLYQGERYSKIHPHTAPWWTRSRRFSLDLTLTGLKGAAWSKIILMNTQHTDVLTLHHHIQLWWVKSHTQKAKLSLWRYFFFTYVSMFLCYDDTNKLIWFDFNQRLIQEEIHVWVSCYLQMRIKII